jgi:uncharacterized protein involved in outer membrane biogenesis
MGSRGLPAVAQRRAARWGGFQGQSPWPAFAAAAAVVLLLTAALAATWFLPPLLDWDRYRDSIARLASDRLGREVRIAGPVSLTLLPEPVLTATGVSLTEAADGIAIRARQLRLRVALGALVEGKIDAEELVLQGAEMRVPWPMRPVQIAAAAPDWFAGASVRIEDGRLTIGGMTFTGIEATLATDAWTGAYVAAGTLQLSARPWHFTVRLTRAGSDGAAGLDVALDGRGPVQGVGARLSGQIQADGTFGGRVSGRGPNLSQLLPAPAVPFAADGRVSVAGGRAAVDELAGNIGGSPVTGTAALLVAPALRLELDLAANRLDLDSWWPALLHGPPAPFPIGLALSAEAAQLFGGTLRHLRGGFEVNGGAVAVREVHAELPGEALLGLAGQAQLGGPAGASRFEGDVALAAPGLRPTLAWLASAGLVPAELLPEGVLRSAELTARAVVEPAGVTLTRLDGRVDATSLSGSLGLHAGERLALTAALQGDRLELDPWLPATWPTLAAMPARLDRIDADLQLAARQVVLQGVPVGSVSLDAAVESGRMTLRRLELTGAAGRAVASGKLGDGGRITAGRLDIEAPSATALAELLPAQFVPAQFQPLRDMTRFWRGPSSLSVQAAGPPEALGLVVTGDLGDLRLEAQPVVDLPSRHGAGVLTLRHPGAPRLAESLGLRGTAAWLGDGSLGLVAQLSVQLPGERAGRVAVEPFDLTAGGLRASGALTLDGLGDPAAPPRLSGRIVADTLPLPLPLPYLRSPEPLAFGALAGWQAQVKLEAAHVLAGASPVLQQAAATLALAEGKLRIDGVSARLADGVLTGAASVELTAGSPALALDLQLAGAAVGDPLFETPLDIASGRLDVSLSATASGYSPAALLATLAGEARLTVSDGTVAGVSLGGIGATLADAAVRKSLAGGSTPFTRLELALQARHGVLQVTSGGMTGPAGAATLAGSVDLAGNAAELRLGLLPDVADPPEIVLLLTGKLDALRLVPELGAVAHWRAAHPGERD